MSTKSSIYTDENYHFFEDVFEKEKIYLSQKTKGSCFNINNNEITVSIDKSVMTNFCKKWLEYAAVEENEVILDENNKR